MTALKQWLLVIVLAAMTASLAACGGGSDGSESDSSDPSNRNPNGEPDHTGDTSDTGKLMTKVPGGWVATNGTQDPTDNVFIFFADEDNVMTIVDMGKQTPTYTIGHYSFTGNQNKLQFNELSKAGNRGNGVQPNFSWTLGTLDGTKWSLTNGGTTLKVGSEFTFRPIDNNNLVGGWAAIDNGVNDNGQMARTLFAFFNNDHFLFVLPGSGNVEVGTYQYNKDTGDLTLTVQRDNLGTDGLRNGSGAMVTLEVKNLDADTFEIPGEDIFKRLGSGVEAGNGGNDSDGSGSGGANPCADGTPNVIDMVCYTIPHSAGATPTFTFEIKESGEPGTNTEIREWTTIAADSAERDEPGSTEHTHFTWNTQTITRKHTFTDNGGNTVFEKTTVGRFLTAGQVSDQLSFEASDTNGNVIEGEIEVFGPVDTKVVDVPGQDGTFTAHHVITVIGQFKVSDSRRPAFIRYRAAGKGVIGRVTYSNCVQDVVTGNPSDKDSIKNNCGEFTKSVLRQ